MFLYNPEIKKVVLGAFLHDAGKFGERIDVLWLEEMV